MDWESREVPKDFSVVAWGESGDVCIEHNGGIESDHFKILPENSSESEVDEESESEDERSKITEKSETET